MLATLASQIPILAPASPPLGSGFFDLTPFDQKTSHSSLRVYQDPQKLILYPLGVISARVKKQGVKSTV